MKTKEEWIKELDLEPHVEGGYFRQTYKAVEKVKLPDGRIRSLSTSILFLLTNQNPSHFHLLSSDEIWYYHYGYALTVHMIHPDGTYEAVEIGLETDKSFNLQFLLESSLDLPLKQTTKKILRL